ncbi:hypothetical protein R9C00_03495 [Flammeovirgaceae bacterium SG7u.111]|nr:hypothetical protein [Flammeovirgaceae bacterium SG7u.132]WPO36508.1 hypothetical protein R9C00_03495 [Flammeovirgaceae bacterium SG7u.111]
MKSLLFLALTLANLQLLASPITNTTWYSGEIYFENGTTSSGEIHYNSQKGIVLLKNQDAIKAYSNQKISAFLFVDPQLNTIRRFIAIGQNQKGFFEVIVDGYCPVLRKAQKYAYLDASHVSNEHLSDEERSQHEQTFDYYMLYQGELIPIRFFQKNVLPLLRKDFKNEINGFMETYQLKTRSLTHNLMVINHYNQLKRRTKDLTQRQ